MKNHLRVGATALALMTAVLRANADGTSTATLDEVIVTATRTTRALNSVPVSASVVSTLDIQDTPAQSLDDILRHVPGMNLPIQTGTEAHPTADNVSMRGLGGIHALVLVDGVPLNDPFFGYVQWGRIPLEAIDHVEVVRGGGSPLWGNFAMGGVINVITRTSDADTAIADAGAGGYGTYRSSLYASYGLNSTNRLNVAAGLNGTDGFNAVPDYARRPFDTATSFRARNLDLRETFSPTEDLVGHVRFNYHENNQQLGTVLSTNNQNTYSYEADVRYSIGPSYSLVGTAFHTLSTFVTNNPTVSDASLPLASQTEHIDNIHTTPYHNTGGSLIWTTTWSGILRALTIGADVNDVRGSDSAAIFDQTGTTQVRTDFGRGEELFLGTFVQASLVPLEELEVLASGRVQRFEVLDGYDGNPGGLGAEANQTNTRLDPRISGRYQLGGGAALRAAWYHAFRAPTLDNLYRGFASDGGIYYPNAQLKPETLSGGEIGIDYADASLRAQLTLYRTEIANLIATESLSYSQLPPGFFYGGRLVNAASARAQGVEAELHWKFAQRWSATAGYTYAQSVYQVNPTDPASVGQQLQDVPRTTVSTSLAYEASQSLRVSADARWIAATAWANADHTNPGAPYQASADPHLVVDLAATYRLRATVDVYTQIQNLLDRRYIVNPGPYNPPERGTPFEAYVGVRVRLD